MGGEFASNSPFMNKLATLLTAIITAKQQQAH
jgi:hypothetical protein